MTGNSKWSPDMDSVIKAGREQGVSAARLAENMAGVTRNAIIGRWNRLKLPSGPNVPFAPGSWRRRPEYIVAKEAERLSVMKISDEIDARGGLARNEAIIAKRAAGLMFKDISRQYGICRDRVRQICKRGGAA